VTARREERSEEEPVALSLSLSLSLASLSVEEIPPVRPSVRLHLPGEHSREREREQPRSIASRDCARRVTSASYCRRARSGRAWRAIKAESGVSFNELRIPSRSPGPPGRSSDAVAVGGEKRAGEAAGERGGSCVSLFCCRGNSHRRWRSPRLRRKRESASGRIAESSAR